MFTGRQRIVSRWLNRGRASKGLPLHTRKQILWTFKNPTMTIKGLNQLLAELESHCPKQAIRSRRIASLHVTFSGNDGQAFASNLYRQGNQVKYGEESYS